MVTLWLEEAYLIGRRGYDFAALLTADPSGEVRLA